MSAPHRARDWVNLGAGYREYFRTRVTPQRAYASMRELYCRSDGGLADWAGRVTSVFHPPDDTRPTRGVLGTLDPSTLAAIIGDLRLRGFYVFDARLDQATCDRLTSLALTTSSLPTPDNGSRGPYRRGQPNAVMYQIDEETIANHPDVQRLISDPSLAAVARAYLGVEPVLDLLDLWWSTTFQKEPNSEAAQLFHFDLDRLNFLKFFCYLTPVGPDNGPHCFVERSHRSKPLELRRDGRLSDEEILAHYGSAAAINITGPAGTIFAADTRGFHKGTPVASGDRLAMQIQYSTDLFGAPYQCLTIHEPIDQLRAARRDHPRMFSRIAL